MYGGNGSTVIDLNAAPGSAGFDAAGGFTVPAEFLFHGEYKRAGNDLKIIGEHGKAFVVHDYFKTDSLHTLFAPDGAALTGDIVAALAGPLAPGEYAQATPPQNAGEAIGRVATVSGTAVAVRNGVAVTLNVGDVVLKGDVVQTQGGSAIGVVFADGTTFDLGANARMVLNDFVYNPAAATGNSALINLVQGSITFVAGQVAHTGDMKVGTPVATMGIRGTAVQVDIDVINSTTHLSVLIEPGGRVGSFNIYSLSGALIGTVNDANGKWTVTPTAALDAIATETAKSPAEIAQGLSAVQTAFQTQSIGQIILQQNPLPPSQQNQQNQQNQTPDQNQQNNPQNQNPTQNPTQNQTKTQIADVSTTKIAITDTQSPDGTPNPTPTVTVVTPPAGAPETVPFVPAPTPPPPPPPLLPPNNTQPFFETNSANPIVHTTNAPPTATQGTLTFTDTQGDTHTVTVTPHAGAAGSLSNVSVTQDTTASSEGTVAYTYTPVAGQTQTDVFDVTVTDNGNLSQTTQISFVLQDHPPVATQASYIVTETQVAAANTSSKFVLPNILGNVTDADGDTVTVDTITAPTVSATNAGFSVSHIIQESAATGEAARYEIQTNHGNAHLAIGTDGQVYLWSDVGDDPFQSIGVGDTATISFNYIVVDGFGGGGGAGATITVQGANDAAVISGATTGAVVEAGGVNNNIPGTPVAAGTLTDTDVDNPANTFQAVLAATPSANGYGTYTVDASGHWTFTLDNTKPAVQALNTNSAPLSDTFVVNTIDGTPRTITVTINGANDAAVISGTATGDVTEAGGVNNAIAGTPTATGTLTDTDIDNPGNTFQAVSTPAATSFGHYTVDATGHWSYTLDNNNLTVQQLNTNSTPLTDTFTVLTQDGTSQTVSIAIHGANDAAVIIGATTGSVTEAGASNNGGTPVATGTLTDTDIDNPSISFQVVSVPAASVNGYGKFTIDSIGNWAYTLDNTSPAVQALNTNGTLSDTFTVLTLDGTPQTITITINGANDAAVISGTVSGDVTEAGGVNNAIAGTPTATGTLTDTDVDNAPNSFQAVLVATPSANGFGKYTVDATGHWSYTLDNNVLAVQQLNTNSTPLTDTFTVLTQDGTAQTVTITIHGTNDAAVIIGATAGSVTEAGASNNGGTPVAAGTLTDTDVDNPSISFQVVSVPAASVSGYGKFTIDSIGNWAYTLDNTNPAVQALNTNSAPLTDTFVVNTIDGTPQTIIVTINGANDAAVISGTATGDVTEAGGVNNAIAGTPTATGTLTDTDIDNPANTFQAVSTPAATSFGHYTVDATGHWSYTLDNNNLTVQQLNTNSTPLTDTFNVLTQDGTSQTVTITIHGANDAAVISGTTVGSVTAAGNGNNGTPTVAGALTDTDVDNTPNIFQEVATATASANGYGTYTVDAAGHWSYALDNNNAAVQGLGPNATLGDTFVVLTQDGTAQTVSITVHGTDHPPTLDAPTGATYNDTPAADTFSPATGTLTGHDIDPGTTLTYGISGGVADNSLGGYDTSLTQSHGTLYVNSSTGAYRFVPNDAAINALTASTTDTFTVTVSDGSLSATQPFTVTLNGVNDTPVLVADTNSVTEHAIVTGNVLGNDNDADTGDVLSVAAVNGNAANVGQAIAGAYGVLVLGSDGHYTYTPGLSLAANQTANDVFAYTASDGHGGSTSANLTITVTGVNDAATVSGTSTGSVTEAGGTNNGTLGTSPISGVLFDTDPDNLPNTFQLVAAGAVSDQQYGTYAMTAGGTWTYTLNESNPAVQALNVGSTPLTDTFTVHTADGTPQQVTVTINGADDAPVVSGPNTATLTQDAIGQWAAGYLTATDVDQGATPLAWSIQGGAAALEDFHFTIDDFKITKSGSVIFDDTFSDNISPPSAPNFVDGSSAAYNVTGNPAGAAYEAYGRASLFGIWSVPLSTLNGVASVGQSATLQTNGGPNSLTLDQSFKLDGTFDLVIPDDVNERYGIRLTNAVPNQPATNDIAVTVRHDADGVHVDFGVANNATGTLTQLQEINLAPVAGDDQIVLHLSHAANSNDITASFDLLHNGAVTSTTNFSVVAPAFITENFVSPVFFAAGPSENDVVLAGTYSRLTIAPDGEWTTHIRSGSAAVVALAAGQQAQDVYNIVVTDDHGVSTIKPITVTVVGVNDAPVLTLPGNNISTSENTALSLTGAHVADPDNGDVITLSLSVANGTITPVDTTLPVGVVVDTSTPTAITVHGPTAAIDQLLNDGVKYTPNTNYAGPDTLQISAHDAAGASAPSQSVAINVVDTASLSVSLSVVGTGYPLQEGQQLDATPTITGDSIDKAATVSYQWQSSIDGGQNWVDVSGATITPSQAPDSFYQLTESDEGKLFRVEASFTNHAGQLVTATSAPTVPVPDVTPVITVPFSYAVDELSLTKNGSQIFDDTFSVAPPYAPEFAINGAQTPTTFLTFGSTWSDVGGKAIMSPSGLSGIFDGFLARLTQNVDPNSSLGLKQGAAFTVSATFDLVTPVVGSNYGIELTDETLNHPVRDQAVWIDVFNNNGLVSVNLFQINSALQASFIVGQQLTPAQLSGNTQIELDLAHGTAGSTSITGSFELINNGVQTSQTVFSSAGQQGTIFSSSVDWTRAELFANVPSGVALSGIAQQGQTLTASAATNDADATLHYQWQNSVNGTTWNNIVGAADSAQYVIQASDVGDQIRVHAFSTDPDNGQSATANSTATAVVVSGNSPPTLTVPSNNASTNENTALSLTGAHVSDPDNGDVITLNLSVANGTIAPNIALPVGVTADSITPTAIQVHGAANLIDQLLNAGVTYTPNSNYAGPDALQVSVHDTAGATSSQSVAINVADTASLSIAMSVNGNNPVQEGQTLVATATITGDSTDQAAAITYQWQSSSDGGTTWNPVPETGEGNFGGVLSSIYQLGELDEGRLFRVEASFTNHAGQLVTATSAPTATTVTDVAPVITVPYSYAVDDLKIVKNGSTSFDDTFTQGPPPIGGNFGSNLDAIVTSGSVWSEANGKAFMAGNGAILNGFTGNASVFGTLNSNTSPQGTGAGQSNNGLKENATFTASAKFDLAIPLQGSGYGIELTNQTSTQSPTELVQLEVRRTTSGGAEVDLYQANVSTDTFTLLTSQVLTAGQLSGNTQIELDLAHNTANTSTITASFELFDNGSQTYSSGPLSVTGHAFDGQTYTRAQLFAFGAATPAISGTAQEGQTLTANAVTNDADATLHYQWQNSTDGTTWNNIAGAADSAQYVVQASDVGDQIRVHAFTTDPDNGQSATANSAATAVVINNPPTLDTPTGPTYNDTQAADTFAPATGTLTGHDVDPGTTLTYSLSGGGTDLSLGGFNFSKAGGYGTLYVNTTTGAYEFLPNNAAINALSSSTTDSFTVTVSDGLASASQPFTVTLNGVDDAPVIAGVTTGAITANSAQTSVFGALSASDADDATAPAWTIVGGSSAHAPDFSFAIEDFQFTKNNGQPAPTVEDKFDDGVAPPAFVNSGSTSSPPSGYVTTGTFTESNGQAVMTGANAGPAVLIGSDPYLGDFARLQSNTNPAQTNGLKIDQNFSVTGTFDLAIPEPRNSYGIRLTDQANGPGNDIVELLVATGPDGITRVQLDQLNLLTGTNTVISSAVLAASALGQDNEIVLTLTYTAPPGATLTTAGPQPVVGSFQLLKSVSGSEVNDGSAVTLANTAAIFTTENYTQASFLAKAPTQADTILQGTYGTLDLTQYGTWTYAINNTLPTTQALVQNQVAQDIFQVQATDAHGVAGTQTITVNVTGANGSDSAPVIDHTPIITEVSVPGALPGMDANAHDFLAPNMSADGRWVVFNSFEGNPAQDPNVAPGDVYLYDRLSPGVTIPLNDYAHIPLSADRPAGETFQGFAISSDGATVAFTGEYAVLDPQSPNGADIIDNIYLYDRASDTVHVLTNPGNNTPYQVNDTVRMDGGTHLVFSAQDDSASSGPPVQHLYVTDFGGQILTDLTLATFGLSQPSGPPGQQQLGFQQPDISANGRYLTVWTVTHDQTTPDYAPVGDATLYTYDRSNGTTIQIATTTATDNEWWASMSNDGRYVVFQSDSNVLDTQVGGTANSALDIFVWDRTSNSITGVTDTATVQGNGDSEFASISGNGQYITFDSSATNLVAGDSNGHADAFIYNLQTHTFQLLSAASGGAQGDSGLGSDLSFGGSFNTFGSTAGNLVVPNDTDGGQSDVFVVDRLAGTIGAVSENDTTPGAPGAPANNISTHGAFHFTDANPGDAHTYLVTGEVNDLSAAPGFSDPAGGIGTFTPSIVETVGSGSGQLAWTFWVDDSLVQSLNSGQQIRQTYTVQISDGHGGTVSQDVTIAIAGTPDAPLLTLPGGPPVSTLNGSTITLDGASVTDVDNGDTIRLDLSVNHGSIAPVNGSLPGGVNIIDGNGADGTLTISGSASAISDALTNGITYTPTAGNPDDVLTVTVHDSTGLYDSQQIAITNNSNTAVDVADGTLTGVGSNDQFTVTPLQGGYAGTLTTSNDGAGGIDWHFTASNNDLISHAGATQSYTVQDNSVPAVPSLTVSIGGPGQDLFHFSAGQGTDALVNFSTQADASGHYLGDTVEIDNFSGLTLQDVMAALTTDSHGNAVIHLNNTDSIVFEHMTQNMIQGQFDAGHSIITLGTVNNA